MRPSGGEGTVPVCHVAVHQARILYSPVREMGDRVQALSRSEAFSMPDALVMGAPVCVAKPGSFEAGILDIVSCLREPSEAADS